jgi:rubrerythrin
MAIFSRISRLLRTVSSRSGEPETDDEEYRCIKCGSEHENNYARCPNCGGRFVAPVDAE